MLIYGKLCKQYCYSELYRSCRLNLNFHFLKIFFFNFFSELIDILGSINTIHWLITVYIPPSSSPKDRIWGS